MKRQSKWLQAALLLFVYYLLFFLPLPYYIQVPGNIFSLDEMVEVDNQIINNPGDFYITTVGIRKASPISVLSTALPYHDLLSESDLYGDYKDLEGYDKVQEYYMNSSINNAIKVAFEAADKEYEVEYKGVHVLRIIEESSFYGELKIGDTIKSVDGNEFASSQEFINYAIDKPAADSITLEVEREGERIERSGKIINLDSGATGIGIGLVDNTSLITKPSVQIHSENIGGPSAGLMFSLEIYTKLISDNIRGSYEIAGTGTIESDGRVGRIGGIKKKIVAADKENIDYFFAPDDLITVEMQEIKPTIQSNYQEALAIVEKLDTDMEIIPVQTIYDAIEFLENLEEK